MPSVLSSPADAKALLKAYADLDSQMASVHSEGNRLLAELKAQCSRVNSDALVQKTVENLLKGDSPDIPYFDCVKAFAKALVEYARFQEVEDKCKTIDQEIAVRKASCLTDVQNATSSLRWLFTGSSKKQAVQIAYDRLCEWKDGAYGKAIASAHQLIGSTIGADQAIDAVVKQPERYYRYYLDAQNQAKASSLSPGNALVHEMNTLVRDATAAHNSVQGQLADAAKKIITKAQHIVSVAAYQSLAKMDVEQLGKVRTGLRIKTLHDAGFHTVDRVYSSTLSQLASVNGISGDAARSMKDAAAEIARGLHGSTRIKLSIDERSAETDAIVMLTSRYIYLQRIDDRLNEQVAPVITPVVASLQQLQPLWFNAQYIASPEKAIYQNAYQVLLQVPSDTQVTVAEALQALQKYQITTEDAWAEFEKDPVGFNTVLQTLAPELFGGMEGQYGLPEELAREIQDQVFFPDGLKVQLRRYQEWGVKYALHQGKIILGDEMGLGKTVQAIATMVSLKNTGARHFMVVCPASVLPNWSKEVEKKSKFQPTTMHGPKTQMALKDWISSGGVAITTYETTNQLHLPAGLRIDLLIVDEAHYIKNPQARRSKAVRAIAERASRIIFLTGTALENKVDEMITLVDVLNPSVAASLKSIAFLSTASSFREKVAPVYYRRKREDVLQELPEKQEIEEYIDLLPEEQDAYENAVLNKDRTAIRRVSWSYGIPEKSAKAIRFMEIVEEAREENRRIIAFSFYKETIRMLRQMLGNDCAGVIDGSVPIETRQMLIDQFDSMPGGSVLLAQITAGGTGLNIQSASVVIICEPQLKPSIEDQAIARAYRMGQARKVLVYRLLAANTIDERITDLLDSKRQAFLAFADKSAAADATQQEDIVIEDKTLGKLIQEEIDRINGGKGVPVQSQEDAGAAEEPVAPVLSVDKASEEPTSIPVASEATDYIPVASATITPSPIKDGRATVVVSDKLPASALQDEFRKEDLSRKEDISRKDANKVSTPAPQVVADNLSGKTIPPAPAPTIKPAEAATPPSSVSEERSVLKRYVTAPQQATSQSFPSIDAFVRYMNDEEITYVDKRSKNGCLWVLSDETVDELIKSVEINGHRFNYSRSAKALGSKAGWYIS